MAEYGESITLSKAIKRTPPTKVFGIVFGEESHLDYDPDPKLTFNSLKGELSNYNPSLLLKPIILIRTKADTLSNINESLWQSIPEFIMEISAVTQTGLNKLVKEIDSHLKKI